MLRYFVVLFCVVGLASSQTSADAKKASLLQRARAETTSADGEAASLSRYEKPLFYARLVEAWHEAKHPSLKLWKMTAIVDLAKRRNDRPEENRQRLVTAGYVLTIFDPIDSDAALKVLDTMMSGLSELGDMARLTSPERAQLRPVASALGTVASRIADSDPERASALARTIMSLRDGDALSPLLTKLRKSRPELAKSMMAEAVQSASITLDSYFLASIARQLIIARQKHETSYPQLNEPLLAAMNEALLQTPANKFDQEESCKLARVARQFIKAIGAETPPSVDEAWERCSAVRMLEDQPPEIKGIKAPTFDDYLAASNSPLEARDRAAFRMQAALLIAQADAPRALNVAAGLTNEEKKFYPGWRKITLTIAESAVQLRHKAGDRGGVQQVLDTVPEALRPVVGVDVAAGARKQPEERAFAIEMLKFARRALDKDSVDDSEMLVGLINGYAEMIPTEAPASLDDAARMLNNIPHPPSFWRDPAEALADIARNGTQSTLPVAPLGYELRPAKVDEEVVDIMTARWDSAMRNVSDKADRLALRLGLIHRLLEMTAAL